MDSEHRRVDGARLPWSIHIAANSPAVAGNVVARAIARGIYAATALPFPGALPAWKDRFG